MARSVSSHLAMTAIAAMLAVAMICAGCATVVEIAPQFPDDSPELDLTLPALTYEQLARQDNVVGVALPPAGTGAALPSFSVADTGGSALPTLDDGTALTFDNPIQLDELIGATGTGSESLDQVVLDELEL